MLYTNFFQRGNSNLPVATFRALCEHFDFDIEQVECTLNAMRYKYAASFGMELIDMVGFEYPFEVYEPMK